MTLYTLETKNGGIIVYQCFHYKTAQAAKFMYESEYGPLKLSRVKYA